MNILEQCQIWNEKGEYRRIIDTLEAIPAEERTSEMDSELARAYNNIADVEDRELYEKALALLLPHKEYFEGDHRWNYRTAFAYYYLDQEGPALHYFEKALEARPGDEDTQEYIDDCRKRLTLPRFEKNFRERTEEAWAAFEEIEAELRSIMDTDENHEQGKELITKCREVLEIVLSNPNFELGFNGKNYEMILSPDGNLDQLFPLVYFQRHAPASILEHWNILVGRQPSSGFALRLGEYEVSGQDVQVWVEKQEDGQISLTLYCEKLLPVAEENTDKAFWMLACLTDQILGEVTAIALIQGFEVLETPKDEPSVLLSDLPETIQSMGLSLWNDAEAYLENSYIAYELEPVKDPEADWRLDVYTGCSRLPVLINDYMSVQSDAMDNYHVDGIVAAFFCYPLDGFSGNEMAKNALDFQDALQETILEKAGEDAITFLGGATGLHCGYLDFIAWDLFAVLNAAQEFFESSNLPWANFHVFRRDVGGVSLLNRKPDDSAENAGGQNENTEPEVYAEGEMDAIEQHIERYFGKFEQVFHELISPDIHVDICIVPPTEEKNYYTLLTMGMGAHRMNVPKELSGYHLERAELAIALPADWKLDKDKLCDEQWYWPIRLLKVLARFPGECDDWLAFGHTMHHTEPFAGNTDLCASILIAPQQVEDGGEVCVLPNGEEVNFYQVIPLYQNELDYKISHDADQLLNKMNGISFVVHPNRPNALTSEALDDGDLEMDDGAWHLESIREKSLPVDEIIAYNHMAIYLRWCIEHDLMADSFLEEYSELVNRVKTTPTSTDLRILIRDELDGQLFTTLFTRKGEAFAHYYYGDSDAPYYPADIDNYALQYFGPARYHSDEFQDEAYLFIPFDEDYYQAIAKIIEKRWTNWQGQEFAQDTALSKLAQAMMEYLGCKFQYFPPMRDDDPITAAFSYAQREGLREGFVPMLITVDDTLWECLVMNSDPESEDTDDFAFDPEQVANYRKTMLTLPVKDGKAVLADLIGERKEEAEDDDMDFGDILGEMEGGEPNNRFTTYWDPTTDMTYPLILAKIPVKNPWEVFAYLPFGGWNECPDTQDLMAAAKYWFEQYGAVPAAMTHDELEFVLPNPVPKEEALELAAEHYGFCPDVVDQGPEGSTVGWLADVLRQSDNWYFWWD